MVRLRKQRRRKRFRYSVNRKRLRNKITGVGKIECKAISNEWETHKSVQTNLREMGLAYDPNEAVKISNLRKLKVVPTLSNPTNDWFVEKEENEVFLEKPAPRKKKVSDILLEDAKAPRVKRLKLPGSVVEWVTYLLDTYGNDYRAMSRDKGNYNQETWKQIRRKIKLFKSIPEHYEPYLRSRGMEVEKESVTSSDDEL